MSWNLEIDEWINRHCMAFARNGHDSDFHYFDFDFEINFSNVILISELRYAKI